MTNGHISFHWCINYKAQKKINGPKDECPLGYGPKQNHLARQLTQDLHQQDVIIISFIFVPHYSRNETILDPEILEMVQICGP